MLSQKNNTKVNFQERVRLLLEQGHPDDALKLIDHAGQNSMPLKNAKGVCLLRLGRIQEAISVFREIAFQGNICIPSETPVVYQANFALAMLMANYKEGAIDIIDSLEGSNHPGIMKIVSAIGNWEKSLSFLHRILYKAGIYPQKQIPIDFAPGELE